MPQYTVTSPLPVPIFARLNMRGVLVQLLGQYDTSNSDHSAITGNEIYNTSCLPWFCMYLQLGRVNVLPQPIPDIHLRSNWNPSWRLLPHALITVQHLTLLIILCFLAIPITKPEPSPLILKARSSSSLTTAAFLYLIYPPPQLTRMYRRRARQFQMRCLSTGSRPFIQHASSVVPNCKNALRGPERSYPRNGGTIIYHLA
jgi:hypothetical protein